MKIQCDVCEAAEAQVVCCADEAALCGGCDLKIHAENKLAARHHRLQLFPSAMPICDTEALGFFFCLEHRAVACRKCDITTHKANSPFSSTHHRLLLTGVKVALDPIVSSSTQISSCSMPEFSECKGNRDGVSEWSRIHTSVEGMLNGNLGEKEDISWTVPESTLATNLVSEAFLLHIN